jgi:hypothetical protein
MLGWQQQLFQVVFFLVPILTQISLSIRSTLTHLLAPSKKSTQMEGSANNHSQVLWTRLQPMSGDLSFNLQRELKQQRLSQPVEAICELEATTVFNRIPPCSVKPTTLTLRALLSSISPQMLTLRQLCIRRRNQSLTIHWLIPWLKLVPRSLIIS